MGMIKASKILYNESEAILDKIDTLEDELDRLDRQFVEAKKKYEQAAGHARSRIDQLETEREKLLAAMKLVKQSGL